ncbi:hypothetical protein KO494_08285 [Lacinutrix sp. C3R15]|uniref:hypothetical protein n=1 Tax=Flavobacteriaceae TaxID=49546 RepID=UPI001C07EF9B|nr:MULTISPECIES: hypothetical protein [Flavobacteriaceae]MBU2939537.1 hypothetical protein [Lacinutrix sp. C3R15]MDO6622852.1 hypothetical protein [Oceanihabitans sp. 1_MG-2023]
MNTIKITILLFFVTISSTAQQKLEKTAKSIHVDKNATIAINTSHTNVEIETWNKDIIEIEAYIESDQLSKEALQKVYDAWQVQVDGTKQLVTINTEESLNSWSNEGIALFDDNSLEALKELEFKLADLPVMPLVEGIMESLNIKDMPKMPNLPELPEGMTNFNFDYEKYQEEGEDYLEKWSQEYEDKYGKSYSNKMENWAKNFDEEDWKDYEKKMEAWGEKFGNNFEEQFGDELEQRMEEWGEAFGESFEKKMEAWAENLEKSIEESDFEENVEAWGEALGRRIEESLERSLGEESNHENATEDAFSAYRTSNLKVKKIIKIKMPKNAKLKMNVRHGALILTSSIHNAKADISHSKVVMQSIDGSQSSINISYSPVTIVNWNAGELKLNYVDQAKIEKANSLVLSANSSNVTINTVSSTAVIDGSFGDLVIGNISNDFKNISLMLENSEANVKLPQADYNLFYKGTKSLFNNKSTSSKTVNSDSNKTIVINAKYSNVVIKK